MQKKEQKTSETLQLFQDRTICSTQQCVWLVRLIGIVIGNYVGEI